MIKPVGCRVLLVAGRLVSPNKSLSIKLGIVFLSLKKNQVESKNLSYTNARIQDFSEGDGLGNIL